MACNFVASTIYIASLEGRQTTDGYVANHPCVLEYDLNFLASTISCRNRLG